MSGDSSGGWFGDRALRIRGCIMNIVLVSRVVLHIEDIGSECIQCTIAAL